MATPLASLSLMEGKIVSRPERNSGAYYVHLKTPEIVVVERLEPKLGTNNKPEFLFKLNSAVDDVWKQAFHDALEPALNSMKPAPFVMAHEGRLTICCHESELAGVYAEAKKAMPIANSMYAKAREEVLGLVELQEAKRRADANATQVKLNAAKDALKNLEL